MIKKIESKLKASEILYSVDLTEYYDDEYECEYVIDDLKHYLDYCIDEIGTENYIVYGAIGTWLGSVESHKFKRVKSYNDIFWCIGRSEEICNVTVFNDGTIELLTRHHDGRNLYTFEPLCNMTVKELKALLTEICIHSDFLSDAEFKALKTKAELLEALDEWIED